MRIIVNGQEAVIAKGSSFDYISENSLFSGADSYTLNITFPLRGCRQNQKIFGPLHLKGSAENLTHYDCEIVAPRIRLQGVLTVTEVSDADLKAQFLEGKSVQNYLTNFAEIYLNEIPITCTPVIIHPGREWSTASNPADHWTFATSTVTLDENGQPKHPNILMPCLPWWNNDEDGTWQNEVIREQRTIQGHGTVYQDKYGNQRPAMFWDYVEKTDDPGSEYYTYRLSHQCYLTHILDAIAQYTGYKIKIDTFELKPWTQFILVCNSLPAAWELPYNRALPHWSLDTFFEQLGLFFGAQIYIDHLNQTITGKDNGTLLNSYEPVVITEVQDEYTASVTDDNSNSGTSETYEETAVYKYNYNDDDTVWRYWSCDAIVSGLTPTDDVVKIWPDTATMVEDLEDCREIAADDVINSAWCMTNYYHYVEETGDYHVLRAVEATPESWRVEYVESNDGTGNKWDCSWHPSGVSVVKLKEAQQQFIIQRINEFAPNSEEPLSSSDESDGVTTLDILPATVDWTDPEHGFAIMLECGDYAEPEEDEEIDYDELSDAEKKALLNYHGVAGDIQHRRGETKDLPEYLDKIYVAFWHPDYWQGMSDAGNYPYPPFPQVSQRIFGAVGEVYEPMSASALGPWSFGLQQRMTQVVHKPDLSTKYTYSFISADLPEVKAPYIIKGKKYICAKLTVNFSENGPSHLIKGEFYRSV